MLSYVNATIISDGIAPSYDMICDALGISNRSKVNDIVKRLEKRGLLSRVGTGHCPRGTISRGVRRIALGVSLSGHISPCAKYPLSGTSKALPNSA